MNRRIFNDEVALSTSLVISIRCSVNLDYRHDDFQLCCYKMLKNGSSVHHAGVVFLSLHSLIQEIVYGA